MSYILNGFVEALKLLITFDHEIYSIIFLSVFVSLSSTVIASIVGIFSGILLGFKEFAFKKGIVSIVYACMALPPVVVGLLISILISRRGPLGSYQLMFTSTAMIIAQCVLITPIVTGYIYDAVRDKGSAIKDIATSLGASRVDMLKLLISELRKSIAIAVSAGFGRGISEVGAVMLVGGNIKGSTRVMTTFITMNNSMGNYPKSLAMGMVLIGIALLTNVIIHWNKGESQ